MRRFALRLNPKYTAGLFLLAAPFLFAGSASNDLELAMKSVEKTFKKFDSGFLESYEVFQQAIADENIENVGPFFKNVELSSAIKNLKFIRNQLKDLSLKTDLGQGTKEDDKTLELASRYMKAYGSLYTVYAFAAHNHSRTNGGIPLGYSFDHLDNLSLELDVRAAHRLRDVYRFNSRQSPRDAKLYEFFINLEDKHNSEMAALAKAKDNLGYAKLIKFSALREATVNHWALKRIQETLPGAGITSLSCGGETLSMDRPISFVTDLERNDQYTYGFLDLVDKFTEISGKYTLVNPNTLLPFIQNAFGVKGMNPDEITDPELQDSVIYSLNLADTVFNNLMNNESADWEAAEPNGATRGKNTVYASTFEGDDLKPALVLDRIVEQVVSRRSRTFNASIEAIKRGIEEKFPDLRFIFEDPHGLPTDNLYLDQKLYGIRKNLEDDLRKKLRTALAPAVNQLENKEFITRNQERRLTEKLDSLTATAETALPAATEWLLLKDVKDKEADVTLTKWLASFPERLRPAKEKFKIRPRHPGDLSYLFYTLVNDPTLNKGNEEIQKAFQNKDQKQAFKKIADDLAKGLRSLHKKLQTKTVEDLLKKLDKTEDIVKLNDGLILKHMQATLIEIKKWVGKTENLKESTVEPFVASMLRDLNTDKTASVDAAVIMEEFFTNLNTQFEEWQEKNAQIEKVPENLLARFAVAEARKISQKYSIPVGGIVYTELMNSRHWSVHLTRDWSKQPDSVKKTNPGISVFPYEKDLEAYYKTFEQANYDRFYEDNAQYFQIQVQQADGYNANVQKQAENRARPLIEALKKKITLQVTPFIPSGFQVSAAFSLLGLTPYNLEATRPPENSIFIPTLLHRKLLAQQQLEMAYQGEPFLRAPRKEVTTETYMTASVKDEVHTLVPRTRTIEKDYTVLEQMASAGALYDYKLGPIEGVKTKEAGIRTRLKEELKGAVKSEVGKVDQFCRSSIHELDGENFRRMFSAVDVQRNMFKQLPGNKQFDENLVELTKSTEERKNDAINRAFGWIMLGFFASFAVILATGGSAIGVLVTGMLEVAGWGMLAMTAVQVPFQVYLTTYERPAQYDFNQAVAQSFVGNDKANRGLTSLNNIEQAKQAIFWSKFELGMNVGMNILFLPMQITGSRQVLGMWQKNRLQRLVGKNLGGLGPKLPKPALQKSFAQLKNSEGLAKALRKTINGGAENFLKALKAPIIQDIAPIQKFTLVYESIPNLIEKDFKGFSKNLKSRIADLNANVTAEGKPQGFWAKLTTRSKLLITGDFYKNLWKADMGPLSLIAATYRTMDAGGSNGSWYVTDYVKNYGKRWGETVKKIGELQAKYLHEQRAALKDIEVILDNVANAEAVGGGLWKNQHLTKSQYIAQEFKRLAAQDGGRKGTFMLKGFKRLGRLYGMTELVQMVKAHNSIQEILPAHSNLEHYVSQNSAMMEHYNRYYRSDMTDQIEELMKQIEGMSPLKAEEEFKKIFPRAMSEEEILNDLTAYLGKIQKEHVINPGREMFDPNVWSHLPKGGRALVDEIEDQLK